MTISDQLYGEAIVIAVGNNHASCYEWMRELGISYTQAVDVMDRMEEEGLVEAMVSGDVEMMGRARKLIG
jgi:Mn-dependent DtxR family transcriptional regulator